MEFNSLAGDYLNSWRGQSALGRVTIYFGRGRNWASLAKGKAGDSIECFHEGCCSAVMSASIAAGDATEDDLFLCRAVMQILLHVANQPVQGAATFLKCYGERATIPRTPLMNFAHFLIEVNSFLTNLDL